MSGRIVRAVAALVLLSAVVGAPDASRAQSGKITLYTSQPDKIAADTVAAFRAKHAGVEVDIFRSGTTEVMNKLQAEFTAGDPRPDLLLIADAVSMEALKAGGRLLAVTEADVSAYPEAAYDRDRTYFGTKLITTGIMYNKAAKKPTSWKDLADPSAKGQIVMPSPLYSGAAAIHMGALTSDPTLGWDYYKALAQNGAVAVQGNGAVANAVRRGEKMYGVIVEFMAIDARAQGAPGDFVFPAEGVTAVTEPVAILKTSKNPAAAKAFLAFLLSKEGQQLAAKQGFLPAHKDVAPPAGFPKTSDVKIMPMNIKAVLDQDAANKRRFNELFGG
jgi:iron(III) transport system substrate-binding protein